jgi:hypothetical protein
MQIRHGQACSDATSEGIHLLSYKLEYESPLQAYQVVAQTTLATREEHHFLTTSRLAGYFGVVKSC